MNPEVKHIESQVEFPHGRMLAENHTAPKGLDGGVEKWFDEVYQQYHTVIFKIAYRILKDRALAEDARQDSLYNIYRGLQYFRGDSKLSTWITRITVNVCLGILRRKKRNMVFELDGNPENYDHIAAGEESNPYRTCSAAESKERVNRALCGISGKHGIVVRLHDLEGQTIPEISRKLNVPSGTVKSRLFYGRQELKEWLVSAPAFVHAN